MKGIRKELLKPFVQGAYPVGEMGKIMEVFKYYLTLKVNVWKYIYLSPPTIIP
jgi:hypothetical protein